MRLASVSGYHLVHPIKDATPGVVVVPAPLFKITNALSLIRLG
jgi:hypothetical protein